MKRSILFGVALVSTAGLAAAQTGRIEGSVERENGAGIGSVVVVINETSDATLTDNSGDFRFAAVPAGTYSLSFTLGDNADQEADVEVVAGQTTRVDKTVDWVVSFAETITVVSASRRAERIVEAPSAVTLVTEEEIAREAAHGQLPKLLEFTPGAEVTQSGLYDYNFNTRGFNSSLNRRVATLIDGRNPSVPFLGAQEWAAISFPLDDLASAELVRGPSAALYGANASSGVLNLVTKQPRYSQGGQLRITGGEVSTLNTDFRWAGHLGSDWYVKLLGGTRDSGDFTVSRNGRAEYARPCQFTGDTNCLPQESVPLDPLDDNSIWFGGLRLDKYFGANTFTIEGGTASVEGPAFQTGIGRVQLQEVDRPWARVNFNTPHWNFLGTVTQRVADRQLQLAGGRNLALDTERVQFEIQTNWDLGSKARFVGGVSHSSEDIDSADPTTGRQTLVFAPISADTTAAFGQIDWSLSDKVKLVLAGRYDDSDLHDSQFSPKGALVYSINPNHTLRLTYNEAFQVANYSEFFLQATVGVFPGAALNGFCLLNFGFSCGLPPVIPVLAAGNKSLEVEEVQTVELGYSGIINGKAFLTIDYYRSDNENFITDLLPQTGTAIGRTNPNFGPLAGLPAPIPAILDQVVGAFVPGAVLSNNVDGSPVIVAVSYTNFGKVDTQGVDLGLNYYIDDKWNLSLTYSWFDFEVQQNLPGFDQLLVPNSPEGKGSVGVSYTSAKWDGSIAGRWVDDFRWAVGPFVGLVESYTTFDLNFNYRVNDTVGLGVTVTNLLDDEHFESFGGDLLSRRALGHITIDW